MKNEHKKQSPSSKNSEVGKEREYLHSISRIGDRLKMIRRDICKMKDELSYMEEDLQLLSDAFDNLFNDFIIKNSKNDNYDTEEI